MTRMHDVRTQQDVLTNIWAIFVVTNAAKGAQVARVNALMAPAHHAVKATGPTSVICVVVMGVPRDCVTLPMDCVDRVMLAIMVRNAT